MNLCWKKCLFNDYFSDLDEQGKTRKKKITAAVRGIIQIFLQNQFSEVYRGTSVILILQQIIICYSDAITI